MGLGRRCAPCARDAQWWTEHRTPPRPISEGRWCTSTRPLHSAASALPPATSLPGPSAPPPNQQHKDARWTSSGAGRAHSVVGAGKTRVWRGSTLAGAACLVRQTRCPGAAGLQLRA